MFKRFVVNVVLVSFVGVVLTRVARNVKIGAFLNSNKDNSFKRSVSFASGFLGDVSIQESVAVDSNGKRIYRKVIEAKR